MWKYKVSESYAGNSYHGMFTNLGWEGILDLILADVDEEYEHEIEVDIDNPDDMDMLITWEEESCLWIISISSNKPWGHICVSHRFLYLAMAKLLDELKRVGEM